LLFVYALVVSLATVLVIAGLFSSFNLCGCGLYGATGLGCWIYGLAYRRRLGNATTSRESASRAWPACGDVCRVGAVIPRRRIVLLEFQLHVPCCDNRSDAELATMYPLCITRPTPSWYYIVEYLPDAGCWIINNGFWAICA